MRKLKSVFAVILVLTMLICVFVGCNAKYSVIEEEIYALDTVINMTVYSENQNAVNSAKAEIRRLEALFSVTNSTSDISRVNSASDTFVSVSDECFSLISTALDVSDKTNGNFDITIYPAVKLWGFTTVDKYVPTKEELDYVKSLIDYKQVRLDSTSKSVNIPQGVSLDLGGIAKGYISDQASQILEEQGVTSAILNLGGNIKLVGSKPNGESYKIGIKSPFNDGNFGIITAEDTNISTAGGYERYFEADGKHYHHILNPYTASPADTDVLSATVVGEKGEVCDALSTAIVVSGSKNASGIFVNYPDYNFIIFTENSVFVSENISDNFELTDNYLDFEIIII